MSILKNNLRLSRSSIQADARSTNSKVSHRICATVLAGLVLFGGGAKAANVLVNPGAEQGLTGWNVSATGYIYAVSTNGTIPNDTATPNNFLAHSGTNTFELFDTTGDSAYIYQDFAADPGSQWAASCWAICYASNYFTTAITYMSVAFYDTNNNVLGATLGNTTYGFGVYGSAVLDPSASGEFGCVIAPPPATDATGWLFLPATNFWYGYIAANTNNIPGNAIEDQLPIPLVSTNFTAPPGTVFVRYQLEFDNSADNGGDVYFDDCVLNKLVGTDPDIITAPTSVTTYLGYAASFTVVATNGYVGEKIHYQWQKNGTNLPAAGGINDINGNTTSPTLLFTNLQVADGGLFDVVVTSINTHNTPNITNSIRSVPVPLTILAFSPLQKINALGDNAGFENAPFWPPWNAFNGCWFQSAANDYGGSTTPVNVFDGTWVALVGDDGVRDNGFWQAVPAAPGTWWKAGGWAYISSLNDFIDGNTCRLQIWFKDANGNTVPGTPTYESFKIYGLAYTNANMVYTCIDASSPSNGVTGMYHVQMQRDNWVYLTVSNVVDNSGIGLEDDIPYNTLPAGVFMVPTNTTPPVAEINFQVYGYCPIAADVDVDDGQPGPTGGYLGNATDAVYWDDMELIQVVPVTNLTALVSGNKINLSFSAGPGLDYSVLYKTNLTDATWSVLTNVTAPVSWQTNITSNGTSYPVTVSDPLTAHSRFYQLQVQ
jgi:hypothetical protein